MQKWLIYKALCNGMGRFLNTRMTWIPFCECVLHYEVTYDAASAVNTAAIWISIGSERQGTLVTVRFCFIPPESPGCLVFGNERHTRGTGRGDGNPGESKC